MIIPSFDQLISFSTQLSDRYALQTNRNPTRENLIAVYRAMCDHFLKNWPRNDLDSARDILFGLYLYGQECISSESAVMPIGSRVFQWTQAEFGMADRNQVTPEEKLIYMTKFYHFIDQKFPEEALTFAAPFEAKSTALENILAMIKRVLDEQAKSITELLSEPPAPAVFKQSISALRHQYNSLASQRFFRNQARENMVNFIVYINDSCDALYPVQDDHEITPSLLQSTMIRNGLVAYVLGSLEAECKVRSPNSELYKLVCQSRNVTQMSDIPLDERETGLNMLKAHFVLLKATPEWMNKAEDYRLKDIQKSLASVEAWIDIELGRLAFEKTRPGFAAAKLNAVSAYLATYGIQTVVQSVTRDIVLPSVGGTLMDSAAGTVGFVVFGPSGALVASQLSRVARDRLLPSIASAVFGSVFSQIGQAIAGVTTGIIILPFTATASGLQSLLNLYYTLHPKQEATYDKLAWVEALLSLPESIFPDNDKLKLSQLQGKSRLAIGY